MFFIDLYYFFLIVVIIGFVYFFVRKVDVYTISFYSSIVYFLPALIVDYDISFCQYTIYLMVIFTIIISSLFSVKNKKVKFKSKEEELRIFAYVTILCMSIFSFLIFRYGISDFFISKTESVRSSVLSYAWVTFLSYSFVYSIRLRCNLFSVLFVFQFFLLFISGDRTHLAIFFIVLFYISNVGRRSLYDFIFRLKPINVLFILVLFLVATVGKNFYSSAQVAFATEASFVEVFVGQLKDKKSFVFQLEPYHTQRILKYVVDDDVRIDSSYLLAIPLQFLPFSSAHGGETHSHSQAVKELFFSDWGDSVGVASNFWSEGYTFMGLVGVFLYCMIFSCVCLFFDVIFKYLNGFLQIAVSFMTVYWSFYIHRNSLLQMISHEKRVFYSALFVFITFYLAEIVIRRKFIVR